MSHYQDHGSDIAHYEIHSKVIFSTNLAQNWPLGNLCLKYDIFVNFYSESTLLTPNRNFQQLWHKTDKFEYYDPKVVFSAILTQNGNFWQFVSKNDISYPKSTISEILSQSIHFIQIWLKIGFFDNFDQRLIFCSSLIQNRHFHNVDPESAFLTL